MAALLAASVTASLIPATASAAEIPVAQVVSSVSFREAPSTSGNRIRYLKAGEQVEVLSRHNDYWLNVKDPSGKTGYISASAAYVRLTTVNVPSEPAPAPTPEPNPAAPAPNAEAVSSVSFRTGPSTNDSRIRYLQKGERITILEKVNSYWYKAVDSKQTVGYVSTDAKYIKTSFQEAGKPADPVEPEETLFQDEPNAVILQSVSFRTGPSTNDSRRRYLQKGERVLVLDQVNSYWYKVQDQAGTVGYVSTSGTYIETTYTEPYKSLDRAVAVQRVIDAGMKYLGTPYEFGSSRYNTDTFDCSDFVRQAFADGIGMRVPGDSRSQADFVRELGKTSAAWRQLETGDLMFFMSYRGSRDEDYAGINRSTAKVTHVGIYLGNGKILHTYSVESGGVRIDEIAGKHWEKRFLFGGSAL